jgi:hypothetical protein
MILRALGCSCGQGLLFSPPLPASHVSGWLEDAAVISASGGCQGAGSLTRRSAWTVTT